MYIIIKLIFNNDIQIYAIYKMKNLFNNLIVFNKNKYINKKHETTYYMLDIAYNKTTNTDQVVYCNKDMQIFVRDIKEFNEKFIKPGEADADTIS